MTSATSDETDFAERAADNDTDGHVHHIAAHSEFLEVFEEFAFHNSIF